MSSKIEKYKKIIKSKVDRNKRCDGLYICKLPDGKESAFLIQDIFPTTDEYIDREFTLGSNHLILPYVDDVKIIETKAKKVIQMIKNGVQLTPTSPDVMTIFTKLTNIN